MTSAGRMFALLIREYGRDGLTELEYTNPYTLLISVMLSAQATDVGVNRATAELFRFVQTPEDMVKLGFARLRELIGSINYNNTKARHILSTSRKLIEQFNSNVPNNRSDLMSLDGVGRKTANIILNIVFGIPTIAVDTHVFRVSNRLGLVKAKNVLETEKQLLRVIPKKYMSQVNNVLVLFGRRQCRALKPQCTSCILQNHCDHWKSLEKEKTT
ncbi:MAG: endonuclease III [Rickettsiales bacterium]|jgi:endonuclease-3|nr:endonuclease III [Rickettsiales bacterium]